MMYNFAQSNRYVDRVFVIVIGMLLTIAMQPMTAQAAGHVTDCSTYGPGPGTLQNALSGGGLVTFGCNGTIIVPEITINTNTVVDATGQTVVLSGNHVNRVFFVDEKKLELINLDVTQGQANLGGGIYNFDGYVILRNSQVYTNTATQSGGGIYNDGGDISLTQSAVIHNRAGLLGGGIYQSGDVDNVGTLVVTTSKVNQNNAGQSGGGVGNFFGNVTLDESELANNTATADGGGLYFDNSSSSGSGVIDIIDSLIMSNQAGGNGGGIFQRGSTTVITLRNSRIKGNVATQDGGGIYYDSQFVESPGVYLTVQNSAVTHNQVGSQGGGIFQLGVSDPLGRGEVLVTGTTVSDNDRYGIASNLGILTVKKSTIAQNALSGILLTNSDATLDNSSVSDNSGIGIEVQNDSLVKLVDSTVRDNGSDGILSDGEISLDQSTISDNGRHGIFNDASDLTMVNSTISTNSQDGIRNEGDVTISHSTINGNGANGINNEAGEDDVMLATSIVANNVSADCTGSAILSLGYNIASDSSCTLTAVGDQPNTDPQVGALADNGGPTFTHALLNGSPAINSIGPGFCTVSVDQRGVARPQPVGGLCDIGAYEVKMAGSATVVFVSSNTGGNVGGVAFSDEDILMYNMATGVWQKYFDGSDVIPVINDLNAFSLLNDGSILMSFSRAGNIPGFGVIDDSDIVRFIPSSLGEKTMGTFKWFLDGSDVGLEKGAEDIDALNFREASKELVISTLGSPIVPNLSAKDEDLLILKDAQFGENSAGTWQLYFDGSDVELTTSDEDLYGTWVDRTGKEIYLTTKGPFSVPGASGDGADIFICTLQPVSSLGHTNCLFSHFWDGSAFGFGSEVIDALAIGKATTIIASLVTENSDGADENEISDEEAEEYEAIDDDTEEMMELDYQIFLPILTNGAEATPSP